MTSAEPGAGSFRRGLDPGSYPLGQDADYEAVVATVPNRIFEALLDAPLADEVGASYLERTRSIAYHEALCLLLEIDGPFTSHYWTNVCDTSVPFVGVIEQTKLLGPEAYGGRHLLYLANYLEHGDPLLELDAEALLGRYMGGLQRFNPAFSRSDVRRLWRFREPDAQPIVDLGYRERMPPLATGAPGLVLANTTQIYPEDRGTNYSVRLADEAVAALTAGA